MGTKAFDRHYPFTQADLLADALRLIATTPPITTTEDITA
jgi:hypothetical protein